MKFCPECGAKLLTPTCKFCPECGYKMPNISNDNKQPTVEPTHETVATPVATTANTPASNLSPEQRELAERFLAELINYDQAIGTYIKDSSNDNREAFYQAYKRAKEIADMLDYETKEPINMEWQTIEQSIDNLRMTSNKFMKFATFGGTCAGEKSLLSTIKNATSGAVSKLKRFLNGQAVASAPQTQPTTQAVATTTLSEEQRELAERFLIALMTYDQAIGTYIKDSSNDNREAFYQAYKGAKEIADMLDYETKEPINMEWQTIEQSIDNLRMTSNKFMKFATFGGTCAGEKSLLSTIKNATSGAVSKLKRAFGLQGIIIQPAPVQEEQKIEETQPVQEKIVATSAEPYIQPQTAAPASKPTPQPVAPVQQPVQVQRTPQVAQPTTEKPKKKKKKVFIVLGIISGILAVILLINIIFGALIISCVNNNLPDDLFEETTTAAFYVDDDGKLYGVDSYANLPEDLVIPDEVDGQLVRTIGMWAFEGCSGVKTITIPDTVEVIQPYAFESLMLTSIIFEDTTTWYIAETSYECSIHDGVAIDVTYIELNAANFEQYQNYYWYKI